MLTAWMLSQQERLAPARLSPATRDLIRKYVPPSPERHRQVDEATLVAVHGILVVLATAVVVLVGSLASLAGVNANATFAATYAGVAGAFCTGMLIHLARYYDALVGTRIERPGHTRTLRWPRASSDADFVVALAAGACFALLSL